MECLKSVVLFVGILAVLLRCSLSQSCPYGCTCTVNESSGGTDVECSGNLNSHLEFHLVSPKVKSIRITDYNLLQYLDLRDQNITDISKVQVSDGSVNHLELSFNHIPTAALSQFNSLSRLMSINLSNNNMVRFDTSNVQGLSQLLEINLEQNNLTDVLLDTVLYTRMNFPYLKIILFNNPLYCSCTATGNALVLFAAEDTPCTTLEGQRSTLDESCNFNTGGNTNDGHFSTNMGSSSSTAHPLDDFTTPPIPVQNVSHSSSSQSSSTRILPLLPTQTTTSTVKVVLQPTSTRQESSHHVTDSVTVIVGVSVTALITVLFFILCALIAVVCRLKRRFEPLETDEGDSAVSYLSPVKTQVSLRGQHYITESTMRLSQLVQPEPYYEELDPVINGLGPAPLPPQPAPVTTTTEHVVVPYHVSEIQVSSEVQLTSEDQSTAEDDVCPPVPNQYLDIHP